MIVEFGILSYFLVSCITYGIFVSTHSGGFNADHDDTEIPIMILSLAWPMSLFVYIGSKLGRFFK